MKKILLFAVLLAGLTFGSSAQSTTSPTSRHTVKPDAGKSSTRGATHGKKKGWYKPRNTNAAPKGATITRTDVLTTADRRGTGNANRNRGKKKGQ